MFASLFDNSTDHKTIIEALAKSRRGLSRDEILEATGLSSGGSLTRTMRELIESGFIAEITPIERKKKQSLHQLCDEYSLFYLKYIKNNRDDSWTSLYNSRSYLSWRGLAFEVLCLKDVAQIKKALGIAGITANSSSWRNKNAQFDLLIDRGDNSVNLCEIKFSNAEYVITKNYKETLLNKKLQFVKGFSRRKNVYITMISTFGIKENTNNREVIDNQVTMDHLFEKA